MAFCSSWLHISLKAESIYQEHKEEFASDGLVFEYFCKKRHLLHLTTHFAESSLENSLEDAFSLKCQFDKFLPNNSKTAGKM